jgi:6,7-dimethyl-8-ribityllumazine synthase
MGTGSDFEVEGGGKRVALVVSRYNESITAELAAGAREALSNAGVAAEDIEEYQVAGVFELAPACRQVLTGDRDVDAIVALGALVRGETPHFDVLAQTVAQALQQLANEITIPLAFGVLTCETPEQAEARADRKRLDRGGEAARAALAQAALYDRLRGRRPAVRGFRLG